jgi:hypothetical protein
MTWRRGIAGVLLAVILAAAQQAHRIRRWAQYEHEMQNPDDDPPDAWEEGEFAWGRLRFHSIRDRFVRYRWGTDANTSDRHFVRGLRRLTRVHARSVEQVIDIDTEEMYNWPWMYAVGVGDWTFSDQHAGRLREYFERGGFLMVDDFHNEREWAMFMAGIRKALPDYKLVEMENDDPILHTVYDLAERERVPGLNVV